MWTWLLVLASRATSWIYTFTTITFYLGTGHLALYTNTHTASLLPAGPVLYVCTVKDACTSTWCSRLAHTCVSAQCVPALSVWMASMVWFTLIFIHTWMWSVQRIVIRPVSVPAVTIVPARHIHTCGLRTTRLQVTFINIQLAMWSLESRWAFTLVWTNTMPTIITPNITNSWKKKVF